MLIDTIESKIIKYLKNKTNMSSSERKFIDDLRFILDQRDKKPCKEDVDLFELKERLKIIEQQCDYWEHMAKTGSFKA